MAEKALNAACEELAKEIQDFIELDATSNFDTRIRKVTKINDLIDFVRNRIMTRLIEIDRIV